MSAAHGTDSDDLDALYAKLATLTERVVVLEKLVLQLSANTIAARKPKRAASPR